MGKKRIIKQSKEEVLKEKEELDSVAKKAEVVLSKKKGIERGKVYIQSTYNNTIITLTDNQGNVLAWSSAGSLGFRGAKKSTPFAASRAVGVVIEKARKIGLREINIFVKGIGSGRDSAIRSLASGGMMINFIKDVTPVPHNGCRPPKVRRV